VLAKETTNETGNSEIVTLASSVHVVPGIETVTVYDPLLTLMLRTFDH
jgi:hypothetical protein